MEALFFDQSQTMPKNFRVYDTLHKRWFQGNPSQRSRDLQTDCIHYFGEVMIMEGTLFDQNEDDAWKKSPEVKCSLDKIPHLIVVQDTGMIDRNGKHVFEGDILECGETRGYVRYDRHYGGYHLYGGFIKVYCDIENCRIIGNIFENPELLE